MICSPYAGHYVIILIDINDNNNILDKFNYYFYDDTAKNHSIVAIKDWKSLLNKYIPYIVIYSLDCWF